MQINTAHFGTIDVDEKGVVDFPEGLPGFADAKKYMLLSNSGDVSPFRWLQSVDKPELAFALVDPFVIKADYEIEVADEILKKLNINDPQDVLVYSIVVVPEDISKISMNLKAPIVINAKDKKGAQVVLDTDRYSVRHYILEELRKREVSENACPDEKERPVYCNR